MCSHATAGPTTADGHRDRDDDDERDRRRKDRNPLPSRDNRFFDKRGRSKFVLFTWCSQNSHMVVSKERHMLNVGLAVEVSPIYSILVDKPILFFCHVIHNIGKEQVVADAEYS